MGMNHSAWKYIFYFNDRPGVASTFWSYDSADKGKQNGSPQIGMMNILKLINRHRGKYNVAIICDNHTKEEVARFNKNGVIYKMNPKYADFFGLPAHYSFVQQYGQFD